MNAGFLNHQQYEFLGDWTYLVTYPRQELMGGNLVSMASNFPAPCWRRLCKIGCFQKWGEKPQNGWFIMENPIFEWMIWGYPDFWKHPDDDFPFVASPFPPFLFQVAFSLVFGWGRKIKEQEFRPSTSK